MSRLLALDTEVIEERRQRAVGVDRHMVVLVYQEIIPRPLADHAEVIDECILDSHREVELLLGYPGALILRAGRQSHATQRLRVVMEFNMKPTCTIKGDMEQVVQRAVELDKLPRATGRARNKHHKVDREANAYRGRRGRRRDWHCTDNERPH